METKFTRKLNDLEAAGFEPQTAEEWLTSAPLTLSSWSALFTARKPV